MRIDNSQSYITNKLVLDRPKVLQPDRKSLKLSSTSKKLSSPTKKTVNDNQLICMLVNRKISVKRAERGTREWSEQRAFTY